MTMEKNNLLKMYLLLKIVILVLSRCSFSWFFSLEKDPFQLPTPPLLALKPSAKGLGHNLPRTTERFDFGDKPRPSDFHRKNVGELVDSPTDLPLQNQPIKHSLIVGFFNTKFTWILWEWYIWCIGPSWNFCLVNKLTKEGIQISLE